ncbi:HtrA protease/chaperone protein [hydrothermal vent metagenome]|uniref:HtrA protease/chaperone protein n=1 Tax=hydrothermal vent metagenome TaxID=652676 RepID=A0A3B1CNQ8_9ZZZZ
MWLVLTQGILTEIQASGMNGKYLLLKSRVLVSIVEIVLLLFCAAHPAQALTQDEKNTIQIYESINASVVNITNIAVTYDFFMNPIPSQASGSGSIISQQGHILTNSHVVKDAKRLMVTLSDGSKWAAKLVGADPVSDLAVIQIKAPAKKLTVIPMGHSDHLRPGQKVLAIGNPFGLERTLTTGIISAIRKHIKTDASEMEEVIQIDAAINPGNSGGPLIDSDGKMIGINTAIFTPSGGSVGIGFAVPINTALNILNELIEKGYVAYPWLGIETQMLVPDLANALSLPVQHGVMVARISRGGPAHRAGIRGGSRRVEVGNAIFVVGGDIIVALNGKPLKTGVEFHEVLKSKKPGDQIVLTLWRGKTKKTVSVRLGERPR